MVPRRKATPVCFAVQGQAKFFETYKVFSSPYATTPAKPSDRSFAVILWTEQASGEAQ